MATASGAYIRLINLICNDRNLEDYAYEHLMSRILTLTRLAVVNQNCRQSGSVVHKRDPGRPHLYAVRVAVPTRNSAWCP